jgi:hypothetical protein
MKSHDINLNTNLPHQRRTLLKAGAAAALGTMGLAQAQQTPTLEVLLANALVGGPLKGILESEGKFKINDNPFQSSTDVVARLVAPGGTGRYNLMMSHSIFLICVATYSFTFSVYNSKAFAVCGCRFNCVWHRSILSHCV